MNNDRSAVIVLVLRCFMGFALFLPLGIDKIAAFPGSSAGIVESHQRSLRAELGNGLLREAAELDHVDTDDVDVAHVCSPCLFARSGSRASCWLRVGCESRLSSGA